MCGPDPDDDRHSDDDPEPAGDVGTKYGGRRIKICPKCGKNVWKEHVRFLCDKHWPKFRDSDFYPRGNADTETLVAAVERWVAATN